MGRRQPSHSRALSAWMVMEDLGYTVASRAELPLTPLTFAILTTGVLLLPARNWY